MVIKLADIDDRLVVKGELGVAAFANIEDKPFDLTSPVAFELMVKRVGDRIRIDGFVRCTLIMSCARCLDEFDYPVEACLDIELAPAVLAPDGAEVELRSDDLDVYYFAGDEIEVDPFIYDEVLLNVPLRPLCREGCEGLCQTCGKNRNYEMCTCAESTTTVFGEKLKSFLTK